MVREKSRSTRIQQVPGSHGFWKGGATAYRLVPMNRAMKADRRERSFPGRQRLRFRRKMLQKIYRDIRLLVKESKPLLNGETFQNVCFRNKWEIYFPSSPVYRGAESILEGFEMARVNSWQSGEIRRLREICFWDVEAAPGSLQNPGSIVIPSKARGREWFGPNRFQEQDR